MSFQILDKHSVKKGMTIENVYKYLQSKGVSGKWIDTETILFQTACHNHIGEGSHKLYYYDNTKLFRCYTGGCGTFDIFELIQKMAEVEDEWMDLSAAIQDYNDAQDFVFLGQGGDSYDGIYGNTLEIEYSKPEFEYYDLKDISSLRRCIVKDWVQEGISPETHYKYEVRHNIVDGGAVFPHLDEQGNCLGIRQRILADDDVKRLGKYRPYNRRDVYYSSPLSFYVYGLNHNADNIKRIKKAIVFEGEKSVMKMDDVLGPNNNISVASFGMHFSRHQLESLKELGVEEITFAFDRQFENVKEGEFIKEYNEDFELLIETYKTINERFGDMGVEFKFILDEKLRTNYKDSPIDCGSDTFATLYGERRSFEEIEKEFKK